MKCGLLGRKLSHSFSPTIHKFLGSYEYNLYECEPNQLTNFIQNCDLSGFNVTIPYKQSIIPYLDELTPVACQLGAVNTVIRREDGTLLGHNSDYFGFQHLLFHTGLQVLEKKVLVLGSGGASKTIATVLRERGATVVVISRTGENNYTNLERHSDTSVIVNTTPVGMYPHNGAAPLSLSAFPKLEGVIDIIYNPLKTALLLEAEALGIPCYNGLWMLVAQAKESAELFTESRIPDSVIETIYNTLIGKMRNIVLIGMPGCGKSTIANLLGVKTGKSVADSDTFIEELTNQSVSDIIRNMGQDIFRSYETQALTLLGKQTNTIIATGGGCVTQPNNLPLLRQNGIVIWLNRDLDKLPIIGRPLSEAEGVASLFATREPLYATFSDQKINNNGSLEEAVSEIITYLENHHENIGN